MLSLFLVLLVIAVAAVMLFSHRRFITAKMMSIVSSESSTADSAPDSSRSPLYRAKVQGAAEKTAPEPPAVKRRPRPQTNKVAAENRGKKFQAGSQPSRRRSISSASEPRSAAGNRKPNPSPNAKVKIPSQKAIPSPDSAPAQRAIAPKNTRPAAPAPAAPKPAKTRSRETYDQITDSKLKLQALAWSDEAVRRMAVINGHIVHEGESIEGYQVVEIRVEDVIVNAGGKSWRLGFGLRQ